MRSGLLVRLGCKRKDIMSDETSNQSEQVMRFGLISGERRVDPGALRSSAAMPRKPGVWPRSRAEATSCGRVQLWDEFVHELLERFGHRPQTDCTMRRSDGTAKWSNFEPTIDRHEAPETWSQAVRSIMSASGG